LCLFIHQCLNEYIKQETKTALDVTKRSWDGVADGAKDTVVDTWNNLVHMMEDPKGVAKTICNEIKYS